MKHIKATIFTILLLKFIIIAYVICQLGIDNILTKVLAIIFIVVLVFILFILFLFESYK